MIYTCEKTLRDAGDKIKPEDKKLIEDKVSALKDAQKSDKIDDIKAKTQDLSQAIQKIGAELYKQAGPQQNSGETKKEDNGPEEANVKEK